METTNTPRSARQPAQINAFWTEACNAGDIAAMLALYEPTAVVVPGPGAQPVSGLEAIEHALRWLVGLRATITYEPRYWLEQGDLAMGSIEWRLAGGTDPEGRPVDMTAVTAEVARRQPDGGWKYVFDHAFAG